MDWAQRQTACPAGHDVRYPNGKASWTACPDCPASEFGTGHFNLWCNTCRGFWSPPDCQAPETPKTP